MIRSYAVRHISQSRSCWRQSLCRWRPKGQSRRNHHVVHDARPFRMAVIGSGPAGFYSAYRLMSRLDNAVVDMYEQLPVPYGLVRFGVAPDHPEVKNCQDKFAEVASSPRFNFIGNVDIGRDLPLASLKPHYDAILFAYGASKDRRLSLPGEDTLKGIYSARAFVGWYNGLPEYADLAPELDAGEEAVVIGQGNVALDVARTLLSGVDRLRTTDITEQALAALAKSTIKRVRVVGRRGPLQASFTIREVRELMTLPAVSFEPIDPTLLPSDPSKLPRSQKRLSQLLSKGSSTSLAGASKSWSLNFLLSPKSFNGSNEAVDHISSITFAKTKLDGSDHSDPKAKVVTTDELTTIPSSLAFKSIGYKSESIPGMEDLGIPFDDNLGIIPNDPYGRIITSAAGPGELAAGHLPGLYCTGWVKRGPTGVIASTMEDAFASAEAILKDWEGNALFLNAGGSSPSLKMGWDTLKEEAASKGLRSVSWADWQKIDAAEKERGRERGKAREKFSSVKQMLEVLG